jgi:hypothetical protein
MLTLIHSRGLTFIEGRLYAGFRPCQGHVQGDVGVMWFICHALQFLPTRVIQQDTCCIGKSTLRHMQKKLDWKSNLP